MLGKEIKWKNNNQYVTVMWNNTKFNTNDPSTIYMVTPNKTYAGVYTNENLSSFAISASSFFSNAFI